MIWNDIKKIKPIATKIGCWDGLKSNYLLVSTLSGDFHVAEMYEGNIDGNEFCDFYDKNDYPIDNVVFWIEIDEP